MAVFYPNEIYHIVDMRDHDNETYGMSRLEPLVYDMAGDEESSKSNWAFFANNAVPNTVIMLEGDKNPEDYK